APAAQQAQKTVLVTRMYDMSPLLTGQRIFPFRGQLPGSSADGKPSLSLSGGLGGGGGFGGGGMGSTAGGGMFSIPPTQVLQQFGGGGMGGIMPMGPTVSGDYQVDHVQDISVFEGLLLENVASETWQDNGEGSGTIRTVGTVLIVRQTEEVHQQVVAFLNDLTDGILGTDTYDVQLWWVPVAPAERLTVMQDVLSADSVEAGEATLTELSSVAGGLYCRLQCRERVVVNSTSGNWQPIIVGITPVVGGNSMGESPQTLHVNVGLTVEARLMEVPEYLQPKDGNEIVSLELSSAIVDRLDQVTEKIGNTSGAASLDRFEFAAHAQQDVLQIPLNQVTGAGTMTSLKGNPQAGAGRQDLQVFVLVRRLGSDD
ncbi:MAG: hypothetical protein KDA85_16610, partial [Planctomycetaceae bacterium]|nr:hypothetical protein [Planctomycetaceae bacterium]